MSAAQAMTDLDDTEGLLDADRDGLLRAAATAGAQVRATAAAVQEGALEPIADGPRPRTVVWLAGRGPAAPAGAMLTAALGASAGE
ncbi:MAG: TobH protein, partial [Mycobacterium sp.]|nr:TobH protein [Mycobacterium sp.]